MINKQILILLGLIFLAGLIRFWQLGNVPSGPNWDEAAIGYNGWSIWQTRRDEWLEKLPASFRSFGDYKAPLAIYLNGLFTSLFGLETWVIRLPFALSGVLGVLGFYFLTKSIFNILPNKSTYLSPSWLALLGAGMLTLSPWHILFTRVGFESGLALTEVVWATSLFFFSLQLKHKNWQFYGWQITAALLFASTFYTYHSAKVMVPMFLFLLFLLLNHKKLVSLKQMVIFSVGVIISIIPFLIDSIVGEGLTRANVTIFAHAQSLSHLLLLLINNVLAHVSPSFLLLGKADSIRHSIGTLGVLYPTTAFLFIFGLLAKVKRNYLFPWFLAVIWIVAGLAPAIIGIEVPHPNRALLALPGFLLFALLGIDLIADYILKHTRHFDKHLKIFFMSLVILATMQTGYFLFQYFGVYAKQSSPFFQDGYRELFTEVWSYYDGNNGRGSVEQIVITSEYGQPYIYALLTRRISTFQYHNGALINFIFPDVVQLSDLDRPNALVVAGEKSELIDRTQAFKVIYTRDGKPRFWLFDTSQL